MNESITFFYFQKLKFKFLSFENEFIGVLFKDKNDYLWSIKWIHNNQCNNK